MTGPCSTQAHHSHPQDHDRLHRPLSSLQKRGQKSWVYLLELDDLRVTEIGVIDDLPPAPITGSFGPVCILRRMEGGTGHEISQLVIDCSRRQLEMGQCKIGTATLDPQGAPVG